MARPELPAVPLTVRTARWALIKRLVKLAFYACTLAAVTLLAFEAFRGATPEQRAAVLSAPRKIATARRPPPDVAMPQRAAAARKAETPRPNDPLRLVKKEKTAPRAAPKPQRRAAAPAPRKSIRYVDWLQNIEPGGSLGERFWKFTGFGRKERTPTLSPPPPLPAAEELTALAAGEYDAAESAPREPSVRTAADDVLVAAPGAPDIARDDEAQALREAHAQAARDAVRRRRELWLRRLGYGSAFAAAWFLLLFLFSGVYKAVFPYFADPPEVEKVL